MSKAADEPLHFSNEQKLRKQMRKRGWTEQTIREALRTTGIPSRGKQHRASRYVHPVSGKSILVDDVTGEIFHLGGKDSDMTPPNLERVYVPLLDEGANVWRPTLAQRLVDGTYLILQTKDYDPDDEIWEFPPGSRVVCRQKRLSMGKVLAAVKLAPATKRLTA